MTDRPVSDPSRFGTLLEKFQPKFAPGYGYRAIEAVRCYQTGNYLACCVLSGAAAESILLTVTIAKIRRSPDKRTLMKEIAAWEKYRNKHHSKADWHFTAEDARINLKHLYPSL